MGKNWKDFNIIVIFADNPTLQISYTRVFCEQLVQGQLLIVFACPLHTHDSDTRIVDMDTPLFGLIAHFITWRGI